MMQAKGTRRSSVQSAHLLRGDARADGWRHPRWRAHENSRPLSGRV